MSRRSVLEPSQIKKDLDELLSACRLALPLLIRARNALHDCEAGADGLVHDPEAMAEIAIHDAAIAIIRQELPEDRDDEHEADHD